MTKRRRSFTANVSSHFKTTLQYCRQIRIRQRILRSDGIGSDGHYGRGRTFSRAKNAMHAAGRDVADDAAENYGPGVYVDIRYALFATGPDEITILA